MSDGLNATDPLLHAGPPSPAFGYSSAHNKKGSVSSLRWDALNVKRSLDGITYEQHDGDGESETKEESWIDHAETEAVKRKERRKLQRKGFASEMVFQASPAVAIKLGSI